MGRLGRRWPAKRSKPAKQTNPQIRNGPIAVDETRWASLESKTARLSRYEILKRAMAFFAGDSLRGPALRYSLLHNNMRSACHVSTTWPAPFYSAKPWNTALLPLEACRS
jgi:hypothetical protein